MGQRDSETVGQWDSEVASYWLSAADWLGFFSGLVDWPGAIWPCTEILCLRLR